MGRPSGDSAPGWLTLPRTSCAMAPCRSLANGEPTVPREEESLVTIVAVSIGVCCIATSYLFSILPKAVKLYLPEPLAQVAVGVAVGALIRLVPNLRRDLQFQPETFFLFLLPPIIFASGYNVKNSSFFGNIGSICCLGFVGTLVSTALVGLGLNVAGTVMPSVVSPRLGLVEAFAFGAVLSALDTVATVSIFTSLGVHDRLYMLVFGESVMNDAASIVSYRTLRALLAHGSKSGGAPPPPGPPAPASFTAAQGGMALADFFLVTLGSVLVGATFGVACSLVFKYTKLRLQPHLETAVFWLFPYLSYLTAENVELSGVMSLLFCGIIMGRYAYFNLSPENQIASPVSATIISVLAETYIFAYLGMSVFTLQTYDFASVGFVVAAIVLCYISRAVTVFGLSALLNLGRIRPITWKEQVVSWYAGGIRGAVSFALVLDVQDAAPHGDVLVTTTLLVILSTVLLNGGGLTTLLLRTLGLDNGRGAVDAAHSGASDGACERTPLLPGVSAAFVHWVDDLDNRFFNRWLRADGGRQVSLAPRTPAPPSRQSPAPATTSD